MEARCTSDFLFDEDEGLLRYTSQHFTLSTRYVLVGRIS